MEELKKEEPKQIKPLLERVDRLEELNKPKEGKLRMNKMKVNKSKMKKSWIGILEVDENGNATPKKIQIEGGAFNLGKRIIDSNYHVTNGSEILLLNGKTPFIIQPTWRTNPINVRKDGEKNETYGDPVVISKMIKDTIKVKNVGGAKPILIIAVIGAAIFVLGKFVFKWF